MGTYTDKASDLMLAYAPKFALAIATLLVGLWVIRIAVTLTRKALDKSKADPTLTPFICNLSPGP